MRISEWSSDVCSSDLELEVELVGELQHRSRVAGLGGGPLDADRVDALGEHGQALVDHAADDARGVEAATVVDDDRGLLDLVEAVIRLRSAERRVGEEGGSTFRSRWSRSNIKKK